jgi:4-hydroxybenzoate polyprenyltransferase
MDDKLFAAIIALALGVGLLAAFAGYLVAKDGLLGPIAVLVIGVIPAVLAFMAGYGFGETRKRDSHD